MKDPKKYEALAVDVVPSSPPSTRQRLQNSAGDYLGGLEHQFNRGMSRFLNIGGEEESEGSDGEEAPRIQLTRRYSWQPWKT